MLIVIDQSHGSRRALTYLVRMLGHRRGLRLCLVHLAPPAMAVMKHAGRQAFAGAQVELRRAGVAAQALDTQFFGAPDPRGLANHILELACASRCSTVVIGRESARYGGTDLAAQLIGLAAGVTIWIVA